MENELKLIFNNSFWLDKTGDSKIIIADEIIKIYRKYRLRFKDNYGNVIENLNFNSMKQAIINDFTEVENNKGEYLGFRNLERAIVKSINESQLIPSNTPNGIVGSFSSTLSTFLVPESKLDSNSTNDTIINKYKNIYYNSFKNIDGVYSGINESSIPVSINFKGLFIK